MIVSYRHNFIFIKSKKTGGSAVENALAPLCGPEDVVTPAGFDEPMQRGGRARNFSTDPETLALYETGLSRGDDSKHTLFMEIDRRCRSAGDFHSHMTAAQARERVGQAFWDQAFKFTIERHPYEKAISQALFSWSRGAGAEEDFAAFFDRVVRKGPYNNARFYCIDRQLAVDRVLRHETLETELAEVATRLGIELPTPLPRIKAGSPSDARPAQEILTQDQKQEIYRYCRFEFDFMGYQP